MGLQALDGNNHTSLEALPHSTEPNALPGWQVRLADFGSAFSTAATDTTALARDVQTLPYRAPEVHAAVPWYCWVWLHMLRGKVRMVIPFLV